eukprot:273046_1
MSCEVGSERYTRLKSIVESSCDRKLFRNAVFFADKLVTFSKGAPEAIFLLVSAMFHSGQHKRAVATLRRWKFIGESIEREGIYHFDKLTSAQRLDFKYIAALCLAECHEWEECITVMGSNENEQFDMLLSHKLAKADQSPDLDNHFAIESAMCLLRGKCYEALQNRTLAILWYRNALQCDVKCFEAFERLIDKRVLSLAEERELFDSLVFPADMDWLKLMYLAKIDEYDSNTTQISKHITELETKYGLGDNSDIQACRATSLYYQGEYHESNSISTRLIKCDPFNSTMVPVHVCTLVELKLKPELFYLSHNLARERPDQPETWFAVGCYYYLIKEFENARRHFSKATAIDPSFGPAWLGFGHAFAAADESDQAMAAYRAASRVVQGSHIPLICIGIEYLRTGNLPHAHQSFLLARDLRPRDPLVLSEIGVVCYRNADYEEAVKHFENALSFESQTSSSEWEATYFNLGHSYRKLRKYDKALQSYRKAASISPRRASIFSAIGFCFHLMGDPDSAVDWYHKALGLGSQDTFTSDLLARALEDRLSQPF